MTPALRWAAVRAICNVSLIVRDKVTRQCPQRRAEADSNRGPSAYQPNALPLGQTGSCGRTRPSFKHTGCYAIYIYTVETDRLIKARRRLTYSACTLLESYHPLRPLAFPSLESKPAAGAQRLTDAVHPFGIQHAVLGTDRLKPMLWAVSAA